MNYGKRLCRFKDDAFGKQNVKRMCRKQRDEDRAALQALCYEAAAFFQLLSLRADGLIKQAVWKQVKMDEQSPGVRISCQQPTGLTRPGRRP